MNRFLLGTISTAVLLTTGFISGAKAQMGQQTVPSQQPGTVDQLGQDQPSQQPGQLGQPTPYEQPGTVDQYDQNQPSQQPGQLGQPTPYEQPGTVDQFGQDQPYQQPGQLDQQTPYQQPGQLDQQTPYQQPGQVQQPTPYQTPLSYQSDITSMYQPTPFELINLARWGYFEEQGIESYIPFLSNYRVGETDAMDIVQAGVADGRLAASVLEDEGYIFAVEQLMEDWVREGL